VGYTVHEGSTSLSGHVTPFTSLKPQGQLARQSLGKYRKRLLAAFDSSEQYTRRRITEAILGWYNLFVDYYTMDKDLVCDTPC
jgi:hypothetical protein